LAELLLAQAARGRGAADPPTHIARGAAPTLRFAAIGLTALLDGLWLEWCLEPSAFKPAEAVALCEAWVEDLCRRAQPVS